MEPNSVVTWLLFALVLPLSLVNGYILVPASQQQQQKQGDEAVPDPLVGTGTTNETAWMVTAIIFIVLFALTVIVCIYLWYLRNAKSKELKHIHQIRSGANKDNQNVWYGGNNGGSHM